MRKEGNKITNNCTANYRDLLLPGESYTSMGIRTKSKKQVGMWHRKWQWQALLGDVRFTSHRRLTRFSVPGMNSLLLSGSWVRQLLAVTQMNATAVFLGVSCPVGHCCGSGVTAGRVTEHFPPLAVWMAPSSTMEASPEEHDGQWTSETGTVPSSFRTHLMHSCVPWGAAGKLLMPLMSGDLHDWPVLAKACSLSWHCSASSSPGLTGFASSSLGFSTTSR